MSGTDLTAAVRRSDRAQGLFHDRGAVVVAVSGGPDSVALLVALAGYAPERSLALHVAHLDHGLRPESAADAAFVAELAAGLAQPFHLGRRDVAALAASRGRGIEEAARAARYAFLAEVAHAVGADTVAVAHSADDQVDTLLMNLVRGTGLAGLAGMRPRAAWPLATVGPALVRPLLALRRADLVAELAGRGIATRHDTTNDDPRFLRNRVRRELRPALAALNPAFDEALLRLAEGAAEDAALLDELAGTAWPSVVAEVPGGLSIGCAALLALPVALQRRLLRRAAQQVAGPRRELGWAAVETLRELAASGARGRCTLAGRLDAEARDGALRLTLQGPAPAASAERS